MTEKLYDINSYIKEFDATVISCESIDGKYLAVLDKTAFFPEEGGQSCDIGTIDGVEVLHVAIKNNIIYHTLPSPLEIGKNIHGKIDFDHRYYNMQHHTGEHILSGIVHKLYGYENVGFHLSREDMTVDFSGELTREQLDEIEILANKAIYECHAIKAYYPDSDTLSSLSYRAKLDLTDNVRIVDIDGVDLCACCAPHVKNTGEVGIIKILDFMRYKGGIRLHAKCGLAALLDYNKKYKEGYAISTTLSVKQDEIFCATKRLLDTIDDYKQNMYKLKCEMRELKLSSLEYTDGNICLFEDNADMNFIRSYVNEAVKKCGGMCGVFAGNDSDGYKYIVASEHIDLKEISAKMKAQLSCRGGGSSIMIQGSSSATKTKIEDFFKNN